MLGAMVSATTRLSLLLLVFAPALFLQVKQSYFLRTPSWELHSLAKGRPVSFSAALQDLPIRVAEASFLGSEWREEV